jgi:hypothetical protein
MGLLLVERRLERLLPPVPVLGEAVRRRDDGVADTEELDDKGKRTAWGSWAA